MFDETSARPVIAILGGTGKEGTGLAMRWASAGYSIVIGSRQMDKAKAVAEELNARLGLKSVEGMENAAAARCADICVLTVVQAAHQSALEGLRDAMQGKILVDATARVDYRQPRPPAPPAAARIAQEILGPGVRVVAAFQHVPSHALKKDLGLPLEADVLACSDDPQAAEEVIKLAEAAGMHGYFAGPLDNAVVVEGLTSILISLNQHYEVKTASIVITGIR